MHSQTSARGIVEYPFLDLVNRAYQIHGRLDPVRQLVRNEVGGGTSVNEDLNNVFELSRGAGDKLGAHREGITSDRLDVPRGVFCPNAIHGGLGFERATKAHVELTQRAHCVQKRTITSGKSLHLD